MTHLDPETLRKVPIHELVKALAERCDTLVLAAIPSAKQADAGALMKWKSPSGDTLRASGLAANLLHVVMHSTVECGTEDPAPPATPPTSS